MTLFDDNPYNKNKDGLTSWLTSTACPVLSLCPIPLSVCVRSAPESLGRKAAIPGELLFVPGERECQPDWLEHPWGVDDPADERGCARGTQHLTF